MRLMNMALLDPIKDYAVAFILGCVFWQYKYLVYCRVYDWWNGKGAYTKKAKK